jgi:hypothetical protein
MGLRIGIPVALALAAIIGACATTQQTRQVEPSGFLGDYSELAPGRGDQARLLYLNPAADFSQYDKVWIDPVTIWHEGSGLADVPRDEAQQLASYFVTVLRTQLAHEFEVVEQGEPRTLRVRTAITEAVGSKVALDIATTVLPPARALTTLKKMATGTHAFVGRAAIEVEILDAVSGERLVAAVDERAGGKALRGATGTWSDVEQAFDYWARIMSARLAALRGIDASQAAWESEYSP